MHICNIFGHIQGSHVLITAGAPARLPVRLDAWQVESRPESRGLHPVGALARPHREEQEKQGSKEKHTWTAARDARNALVQL